MIKIIVSGTDIQGRTDEPVTSGSIGLPVQFTFDKSWNNLHGTVIFKAGSVVINMPADNCTTIPWEVLQKAGESLIVGIYGVDSDGTIAIPTIWTTVCTIHEGAKVEGTQPSAPPTTTVPPVDDGNTGEIIVTAVEPAESDLPKVFFGGALQQTKDEVVVPFRYISKTQDISGYAEIKAQGNSSMNYPKKNQTVKLFKDADCTEKLKVDFRGWGEQNKFVFKANWIDITHARNIVSARLWADIVKTRSNYAELPELLRTSPNQGVVDGFPVKVYAAGVYQGRYTLNIPKDKWMSNMDDELNTHCILCGEDYVSGCFRASARIDGYDWTDEIHDSVPSSIKTRWNEVISFVMNSTDEEFRSNLGNYFDIPSLLDYHLFGLASCGLDAYGKNQLYFTYDGVKWIAVVYDMDSSWGLYWNGSKLVPVTYSREEYEDMISGRGGNLLYMRLEQLFYQELKARWAELKSSVLSIENIINRFERFTDIAPAELVKEDYAPTTGKGAFTGIPSQSSNNIQQIRSFALARLEWTDAYVEALTGEGGGEEPGGGDNPGGGEDNPTETYLRRDYTPNGTSFVDTADVDFANGDYIEADVDLSTCSVNGMESIVTIGAAIDTWRDNHIHFHFQKSSSKLQVNAFSAQNANARLDMILPAQRLHLKFSSAGVEINGAILDENSGTWTSNSGGETAMQAYASGLARVLALTSVQVGSMEGATRSNATYNYIKVCRQS